MKTWKKILLIVLLVVVVLLVAIPLTGNSHLFKAFNATYLRGETSATIGDARYFDTRTVPAADNPWAWPIHTEYNKAPLPDKLQETLQAYNSVAFLVVKNDSIIQEHYWDGYSDSSRSNSFSMAKSIVTMLTQIAIQKGYLEGWDQKVQPLLPELKGKYAGELELWHLSTMSSGLNWDESYSNPFSVTAKAYYGPDIEQTMYSLAITEQPGQAFRYQSGSTQLLGMALMAATGKSLAELAAEWLWQPMGAQHTAQWHTDSKDGMELAYCCYNSNARDFARFGKLMSHHGHWNGTQLIDSSFIPLASEGALAPYYGYSFWIDPNAGTPVFYQRGILGQYIINIPEEDLVIVRLGHQRGPGTDYHHTEDFYVMVEAIRELY